MEIRSALPSDVPAIRAIYAHEVLHGLATFEEEVPTLEEMARRHSAIVEKGLPYLVACLDETVAGYAYAAPFRPRPAYRYTVENSVYVAADHRGHGVGKALLQQLILECQAGGLRQMVAVIGDSANIGSIALHGSLGFEHRGTLEAVGFKLGQWVDTVTMQKRL